MFKVSKLNPKDTTLDEIHGIQEKHYEQRKNWDDKRLFTEYHKTTQKIVKELGINFKIINKEVIKR